MCEDLEVILHDLTLRLGGTDLCTDMDGWIRLKIIQK